MIPINFAVAEVIRFTIVLSRVGGIMVFAPFFSSRSIPYQIRVALSLMITVMLVPALPLGKIPANLGAGQVLSVILGEVAVGMLMGLIANFIFAGLQVAGQIISFQMGFSIINLIDPQSEVEMSVFSFFEDFIGLMLFLIINGHHWFIMAVSESFSYIPVKGIHLQGPVVEEIIRLSARLMISGVQIAAPILAVTIIADVILSIIGRAAPQIPVFIVGMPLKILVGFTCLSISFYFIPRYLEGAFAALFKDIFGLMHKMA
jgi:flagellar biosynthesis protein FliR